MLQTESVTFPPLRLKTHYRQTGEAKASLSPGLLLHLISAEEPAADVFRAVQKTKGAKGQRGPARDSHADHLAVWQRQKYYDKS